MNSRTKLISLYIMAFTMMLMPIETFALNGSWRGELDLWQMKLPLVFNFSCKYS